MPKMEVHETWTALERELGARVELDKARLRGPATNTDVARVEAAIGARLPPGFVASLAVHDGQGRSGLELIGGWRLFSLEAIVSACDKFVRMAQDGVIEWDRRWVPFATDGNGNHLVLDLAPGHAYGRVAEVPRLVRAPTPVAADFAAWLRAVTDDMAAGVYDDELAAYAD